MAHGLGYPGLDPGDDDPETVMPSAALARSPSRARAGGAAIISAFGLIGYLLAACNCFLAQIFLALCD